MYKFLSRSVSKSHSSTINFTKMCKKVSKTPSRSNSIFIKSLSEPSIKSEIALNRTVEEITTESNPEELPDKNCHSALTEKYSYQMVKKSLFSDRPRTADSMRKFHNSSVTCFYSSSVNQGNKKNSKSFQDYRSEDMYNQAMAQCMKIKFQRKQTDSPLEQVNLQPRPIKPLAILNESELNSSRIESNVKLLKRKQILSTKYIFQDIKRNRKTIKIEHPRQKDAFKIVYPIRNVKEKIGFVGQSSSKADHRIVKMNTPSEDEIIKKVTSSMFKSHKPFKQQKQSAELTNMKLQYGKLIPKKKRPKQSNVIPINDNYTTRRILNRYAVIKPVVKFEADRLTKILMKQSVEKIVPVDDAKTIKKSDSTTKTNVDTTKHVLTEKSKIYKLENIRLHTDEEKPKQSSDKANDYEETQVQKNIEILLKKKNQEHSIKCDPSSATSDVKNNLNKLSEFKEQSLTERSVIPKAKESNFKFESVQCEKSSLVGKTFQRYPSRVDNRLPSDQECNEDNESKFKLALKTLTSSTWTNWKARNENNPLEKSKTPDDMSARVCNNENFRLQKILSQYKCEEADKHADENSEKRINVVKKMYRYGLPKNNNLRKSRSEAYLPAVSSQPISKHIRKIKNAHKTKQFDKENVNTDKSDSIVPTAMSLKKAIDASKVTHENIPQMVQKIFFITPHKMETIDRIKSPNSQHQIPEAKVVNIPEAAVKHKKSFREGIEPKTNRLYASALKEKNPISKTNLLDRTTYKDSDMKQNVDAADKFDTSNEKDAAKSNKETDGDKLVPLKKYVLDSTETNKAATGHDTLDKYRQNEWNSMKCVKGMIEETVGNIGEESTSLSKMNDVESVKKNNTVDIKEAPTNHHSFKENVSDNIVFPKRLEIIEFVKNPRSFSATERNKSSKASESSQSQEIIDFVKNSRSLSQKNVFPHTDSVKYVPMTNFTDSQFKESPRTNDGSLQKPYKKIVTNKNVQDEECQLKHQNNTIENSFFKPSRENMSEPKPAKPHFAKVRHKILSRKKVSENVTKASKTVFHISQQQTGNNTKNTLESEAKRASASDLSKTYRKLSPEKIKQEVEHKKSIIKVGEYCKDLFKKFNKDKSEHDPKSIETVKKSASFNDLRLLKNNHDKNKKVSNGSSNVTTPLARDEVITELNDSKSKSAAKKHTHSSEQQNENRAASVSVKKCHSENSTKKISISVDNFRRLAKVLDNMKPNLHERLKVRNEDATNVNPKKIRSETKKLSPPGDARGKTIRYSEINRGSLMTECINHKTDSPGNSRFDSTFFDYASLWKRVQQKNLKDKFKSNKALVAKQNNFDPIKEISSKAKKRFKIHNANSNSTLLQKKTETKASSNEKEDNSKPSEFVSLSNKDKDTEEMLNSDIKIIINNCELYTAEEESGSLIVENALDKDVKTFIEAKQAEAKLPFASSNEDDNISEKSADRPFIRKDQPIPPPKKDDKPKKDNPRPRVSIILPPPKNQEIPKLDKETVKIKENDPKIKPKVAANKDLKKLNIVIETEPIDLKNKLLSDSKLATVTEIATLNIELVTPIDKNQSPIDSKLFAEAESTEANDGRNQDDTNFEPSPQTTLTTSITKELSANRSKELSPLETKDTVENHSLTDSKLVSTLGKSDEKEEAIIKSTKTTDVEKKLSFSSKKAQKINTTITNTDETPPIEYKSTNNTDNEPTESSKFVTPIKESSSVMIKEEKQQLILKKVNDLRDLIFMESDEKLKEKLKYIVAFIEELDSNFKKSTHIKDKSNQENKTSRLSDDDNISSTSPGTSIVSQSLQEKNKYGPKQITCTFNETKNEENLSKMDTVIEPKRNSELKIHKSISKKQPLPVHIIRKLIKLKRQRDKGRQYDRAAEHEHFLNVVIRPQETTIQKPSLKKNHSDSSLLTMYLMDEDSFVSENDRGRTTAVLMPNLNLRTNKMQSISSDKQFRRSGDVNDNQAHTLNEMTTTIVTSDDGNNGKVSYDQPKFNESNSSQKMVPQPFSDDSKSNSMRKEPNDLKENVSIVIKDATVEKECGQFSIGVSGIKRKKSFLFIFNADNTPDDRYVPGGPDNAVFLPQISPKNKEPIDGNGNNSSNGSSSMRKIVPTPLNKTILRKICESGKNKKEKPPASEDANQIERNDHNAIAKTVPTKLTKEAFKKIRENIAKKRDSIKKGNDVAEKTTISIKTVPTPLTKDIFNKIINRGARKTSRASINDRDKKEAAIGEKKPTNVTRNEKYKISLAEKKFPAEPSGDVSKSTSNLDNYPKETTTNSTSKSSEWTDKNRVDGEQTGKNKLKILKLEECFNEVVKNLKKLDRNDQFFKSTVYNVTGLVNRCTNNFLRELFDKKDENDNYRKNNDTDSYKNPKNSIKRDRAWHTELIRKISSSIELMSSIRKSLEDDGLSKETSKKPKITEAYRASNKMTKEKSDLKDLILSEISSIVETKDSGITENQSPKDLLGKVTSSIELMTTIKNNLAQDIKKIEPDNGEFLSLETTDISNTKKNDEKDEFKRRKNNEEMLEKIVKTITQETSCDTAKKINDNRNLPLFFKTHLQHNTTKDNINKIATNNERIESTGLKSTQNVIKTQNKKAANGQFLNRHLISPANATTFIKKNSETDELLKKSDDAVDKIQTEMKFAKIDDASNIFENYDSTVLNVKGNEGEKTAKTRETSDIKDALLAEDNVVKLVVETKDTKIVHDTKTRPKLLKTVAPSSVQVVIEKIDELVRKISPSEVVQQSSEKSVEPINGSKIAKTKDLNTKYSMDKLKNHLEAALEDFTSLKSHLKDELEDLDNQKGSIEVSGTLFKSPHSKKASAAKTLEQLNKHESRSCFVEYDYSYAGRKAKKLQENKSECDDCFKAYFSSAGKGVNKIQNREPRIKFPNRKDNDSKAADINCQRNYSTLTNPFGRNIVQKHAEIISHFQCLDSVLKRKVYANKFYTKRPTISCADVKKEIVTNARLYSKTLTTLSDKDKSDKPADKNKPKEGGEEKAVESPRKAVFRITKSPNIFKGGRRYTKSASSSSTKLTKNFKKGNTANKSAKNKFHGRRNIILYILQNQINNKVNKSNAMVDKKMVNRKEAIEKTLEKFKIDVNRESDNDFYNVSIADTEMENNKRCKEHARRNFRKKLTNDSATLKQFQSNSSRNVKSGNPPPAEKDSSSCLDVALNSKITIQKSSAKRLSPQRNVFLKKNSSILKRIGSTEKFIKKNTVTPFKIFSKYSARPKHSVERMVDKSGNPQFSTDQKSSDSTTDKSKKKSHRNADDKTINKETDDNKILSESSLTEDRTLKLTKNSFKVVIRDELNAIFDKGPLEYKNFVPLVAKVEKFVDKDKLLRNFNKKLSGRSEEYEKFTPENSKNTSDRPLLHFSCSSPGVTPSNIAVTVEKELKTYPEKNGSNTIVESPTKPREDIRIPPKSLLQVSSASPSENDTTLNKKNMERILSLSRTNLSKFPGLKITYLTVKKGETDCPSEEIKPTKIKNSELEGADRKHIASLRFELLKKISEEFQSISNLNKEKISEEKNKDGSDIFASSCFEKGSNQSLNDEKVISDFNLNLQSNQKPKNDLELIFKKWIQSHNNVDKKDPKDK